MLSRYAAAITQLNEIEQRALRTGLNLSSEPCLLEALNIGCHDGADVVLTLLHAGHHSAVELLMGRPIVIFPPQPTPYDLQRAARPAAPDLGDTRRIRVSVPQCPLVVPSARARWELMATCRTVQGYISRVPRWRALRDLREWAAAGWLEVA